jgi:hypothetical protein
MGMRSSNIAREDNEAGWNAQPKRYRLYGLYKGKVEQRVDPTRLYKLRVRVVGVHDDSIQVADLPWASPKHFGTNKSGRVWIPPVGEYVWIQFEDGHLEYPVWEAGWHSAASATTSQAIDGQTQAADGVANAANAVYPTSSFGGDQWTYGALMMEQFSGVDPDDQPNNFIDRSPLGKHSEFDDRKGQQKVKLSDQLDNFLWINTEWGVSTLEASRGLQNDPTVGKYRGLTLNSEDQVMQMYTFSRWQFTSDDKNKFWDWNSPAGFRVRLDEKNQRIDVWTQNGQHLVMDDSLKRVLMKTAAGRYLLLDDANQLMQLGSATGSTLQFNDAGGMVTINCVGDLTVQCTSIMNFIAGQEINMLAPTINLNSSSPATVTVVAAPTTQSPMIPVKAVRAPDANDEYGGD